MHPVNPLKWQCAPDAPYFIILLCLTPDDFTRQEESAANQWVNQTNLPMHLVNPLKWQCTQMHPTFSFYFTYILLTPDDFIRQGESAATQWVNHS